jgi:very-short-patch-repair endonuclease
MTEAERRLWRELQQLGLPNRFRRQHPIGKYVVDFACPAAKLALNSTAGNTHTRSAQMNYAAEKSAAKATG